MKWVLHFHKYKTASVFAFLWRSVRSGLILAVFFILFFFYIFFLVHEIYISLDIIILAVHT